MIKLSFLSLLLVSSFASAEEARRANAHVHGLNNLSMVISQNQVARCLYFDRAFVKALS